MSVQSSFFIITGGPGSGKTTLLNKLQEQGIPHVPEVAREIIREQMNSGGNALPWGNQQAYTTLMLERSISSFQCAAQNLLPSSSSILLFDRGIPDTVAWCRLIGQSLPPTLDQAARDFRYNPTVFILPPWKEIYETDAERKQSWEEAVLTYEALYKAYTDYGYQLSIVPTGLVEERAAFVKSACERIL